MKASAGPGAIKVLLIGDSGVGKSSLLMRFAQDTFDEDISATIGIDFRVKAMTLDDGSTVNLQIWDTAGQERFRTLTSSYYRNAQAVILVYDVTSASSFESVTGHWLEEARSFCGGDPAAVTYMLVANKIDMMAAAGRGAAGAAASSGGVSEERAAAFAREHRMLYCRCSAKTKEGVMHAFEEVGRVVVERRAGRGFGGSATKGAVNLDAPAEAAGNGGGMCGC